jgi:hypothetical protein
MTCEERFYELLALEFGDPEYFTVHHLTVPCYYIQHGLYSAEREREAYEKLQSFIGGEIKSGMTLVGTIADIRTDIPADFCSNVKNWARSILMKKEAAKL